MDLRSTHKHENRVICISLLCVETAKAELALGELRPFLSVLRRLGYAVQISPTALALVQD